MGSVVSASCSCGYKTPALYVGAGMMSFGRSCMFPAYCSTGKHLVMVDMYDNPLKCPSTRHRKPPTPYNDESLVEKLGKREVVSWEDNGKSLKLTNGSYLCPECQNFTLKFKDRKICWD